MPVPPYGTAIQEAIRSGDLSRMKAAAVEAEKWLAETREIEAAAQKAERLLATRGVRPAAASTRRAPAAIVLYGVVMQDMMRAGDFDKLPELLDAAKARMAEAEKVKPVLEELQKKLGRVGG